MTGYMLERHCSVVPKQKQSAHPCGFSGERSKVPALQVSHCGPMTFGLHWQIAVAGSQMASVVPLLSQRQP